MVTTGDDTNVSSSVNLEHKLRQMNDQWVQALVRRDTEALIRIMADDFVWIFPFDGDSRDQFIADVRSGDLIVETLTRDNVEVRIFDRTAVITSLDKAQWRYKGHQILGYYRIIQVYVERQSGWQLATMQASPIAS